MRADGRLRVPTFNALEQKMVGTAQERLCPPYNLCRICFLYFVSSAKAPFQSSGGGLF
jgi:hypothetical protein